MHGNLHYKLLRPLMLMKSRIAVALGLLVVLLLITVERTTRVEPSPFVQSEWDSGIVTLSYGDRTEVLDFTKGAPS